MEQTLEKYKKQFENLNTAKKGDRMAPHKAVLLLAIMELVDEGVITTEKIELTEDLCIRFLGIWYENIGRNPLYKPNIDKPFWHMQNEPFYHLKMKDDSDLASIGNPYSERKLRENTYAVIDKELFELMRNEATCGMLRISLTKTYLQGWNVGLSPSVMPALLVLEMLIRMVA